MFTGGGIWMIRSSVLVRLVRGMVVYLPLSAVAVLAACSGAAPTPAVVEGEDGGPAVVPRDGGGTASPDGGPSDAGPAATDSGADGAFDAGPQPVSGSVHFSHFDAPLAGAAVTIAGTSATAGANGGFSVAGVPSTYDAEIVYTLSGAAMIETWKELTTRSPILEAGSSVLGAANTTTVSGTISGIGLPIPANTIVRVFARNRYGASAVFSMGAGADGKYTLSPNWYGPTTRDLVVHAIAYTPVDSHASAFLGYGEATATITAGQAATIDVALSPTATTNVNGTIAPASGTLSVALRFGTAMDDGASYAWSVPAASPFSLLAPKVAGGSLLVQAYRPYPGTGNLNDIKRELPAGQTYDFVEFGEPSLVAPVAGASFAPGMTFSWNAPPGSTGGTYLFRLGPAGSSIAPTFRERTTATSVVIPASFVPAKGSYSWTVTYFPNVAGADGLTGGDATLLNARRETSRSITVP